LALELPITLIPHNYKYSKQIFYWCFDLKFELILALLLLPIVSAVSDTTPPNLVSFDFEPKVIDVSKSDQTITVTVQLEDNLSGVWNMGAGSTPSQVEFTSPSGEANISAGFWVNHNLVLGGMLNGTYKDDMTLLQHSESGEWHIASFLVIDNVGNRQKLNETQMKKLGYPTAIEVKS
jgi:hypothetical protein